MMLDVVKLTQQLIAQASVTPCDAECQPIIANFLRGIGFTVTDMPCDKVSNLWARYGDKAPLVVFAGHTDVVSAGAVHNWKFDPFIGTVADGKLYGRGAADMKGSLAAMLIATAQFIQQHPNFAGSIGFLITSGEEGDDFQHGTPFVMEQLSQQAIKIDYCIVGEPSSHTRVADTIKIGRRGSLSGSLKILGKQGHIAYPHLANNPIHAAARVLSQLCAEKWDDGNEFFQPTSFQISNIHAGDGSKNVIPGEVDIEFNFRYATTVDHISLQQRVTQILQDAKLEFNLTWRLNGLPFLTNPGQLINATQQAISSVMGKAAELSTSGGTSDGRFIAPYGIAVLELGPVNATIHQVNECVDIQELLQLEQIYHAVLRELLML